jgi:hypothetical protein
MRQLAQAMLAIGGLAASTGPSMLVSVCCGDMLELSWSPGSDGMESKKQTMRPTGSALAPITTSKKALQ